MIWNYLSVGTVQFGFTKIKGAKINLHTISPSFGAYKLMGFTVSQLWLLKVIFDWPVSDLIYVDAPVAPIHVCWVMRVSQQHLCQTLPKSVDVHWSYRVQNWCRFWDAVYFIWSGMWIVNPISLPYGSVLAFWFKHWVFSVFLFIVSGGSRGWLVTPHGTAAYFMLLSKCLMLYVCSSAEYT